MNTRRNREAGRGDDAAEYLQGPDDFAAWLHAAGLAGGSPVVDQETFAGALALREAVSALVTATVVGDSVPGPAVRSVNQWLALAPERPFLRIDAGALLLGPPGTTARRAGPSP